MIRYLIKNNIKLMSRSMINILLLIIMPLILIAVLSNAFNDLMARYEDREITAGYRIKGDNVPSGMTDAFKEAAADNDILLCEYPDGDPEETIRENDICALVVIDDDSYTLYRNNDDKEIAKVFEYFVNAFYENMAAGMMGIDTDAVNLRVEYPDYKPSIDSIDYYGIAEVIFFVWNAIICGAGIFISERKNRIDRKFQVSNVSETKLYLGKLISIVAAVGPGMIITSVLSMLLFGVHWGNPLLSALIIILSTAAATSLGLLVYYACDNTVATIIIVFTIVWFMGYFGGCFETYMFASHPKMLTQLSPIYHVNRALTELSCMGHSNYTVSALAYCGLLTIVCSALAVLTGWIKRRGRA